MNFIMWLREIDKHFFIIYLYIIYSFVYLDYKELYEVHGV